MKRTILALLVMKALFVTAQPTQVWIKYDLVLGEHQNNIVNGIPNASLLMADVINYNGNYRMYYTQKNADSAQIRYADSPDGINWTDGGVIMTSNPSHDTINNRRWEINGPSVLKLDNGQYRMYYCSAPYYHNQPPKFCVNTAISDDGTTFTDEGIQIDIVPFDTASDLSLAGHGTYFENDSGFTTAIFSGNASTQLNQPSSLFMSRSYNGLDFINIFKRYQGWHDPIVIKQNTSYKIFAMYMLSKIGSTTSDDGLNWSNPLDSISLQDSLGNSLVEGNAGIGDIGGICMPNGEIFLYTNFGAPSRDIALFRLSSITNNQLISLDDEISVFPNPASEELNYKFNVANNSEIRIEIYNSCLALLYSGISNNDLTTIDIRHYPSGVYYTKVIRQDSIAIRKFVIL